jgi:hypothetical protein
VDDRRTLAFVPAGVSFAILGSGRNRNASLGSTESFRNAIGSGNVGGTSHERGMPFMNEIELVRSPSDRRLYTLGDRGSLRLNGLFMRSAIAETDLGSFTIEKTRWTKGR